MSGVDLRRWGLSAVGKWRNPADTPLDRAKAVAHAYREHLRVAAPDVCAFLDRNHRDVGQAWIAPAATDVGMDDVLTIEEAADYCCVQVKTIYEWRRRGLSYIDTDEGSRYVVEELIRYQSERRQRRMPGAA